MFHRQDSCLSLNPILFLASLVELLLRRISSQSKLNYQFYHFQDKGLTDVVLQTLLVQDTRHPRLPPQRIQCPLPQHTRPRGVRCQ